MVPAETRGLCHASEKNHPGRLARVGYAESSMKSALILSSCLLGLACSATDPEAGSGNAAGSGGSSAGASAGNVSGAAGASSVAGMAGSAGAAPSGGTGGGGVSSGGSSGAGGASAAGTGGTAGASAGSGGSAGGSASCAPDAVGKLGVVGDTVHDAKTCLDWMKTTQDNVNYAAAETFCNDSMLGGFDDWRIPNVNELASIITACGKYAPEGPIDTTVFDIKGDGYWTTTSAGELNKVCAIGMANAGGYYHYGTAGPQVVRCVRGTGVVETVKDCTVAQGCKDW